jgi:hypothetical protein
VATRTTSARIAKILARGIIMSHPSLSRL